MQRTPKVHENSIKSSKLNIMLENMKPKYL